MYVMDARWKPWPTKKHLYQNNNVGLIFALLDLYPYQVWSLLLLFISARIVSMGIKYVTGAPNFSLVRRSIFLIMTGIIFFVCGLNDGSLSDEEWEFNDSVYPNYRPNQKTGVILTFWALLAHFGSRLMTQGSFIFVHLRHYDRSLESEMISRTWRDLEDIVNLSLTPKVILSHAPDHIRGSAMWHGVFYLVQTNSVYLSIIL